MSAIWIANPFDNLPAEGAKPQRYALLARELASRGHRVVWWTSAFSHSKKDLRRCPDGNPLPTSWTGPDGVEMRLVPAPPYRSNVGIARIRNHMDFADNLASIAMRETETGRLHKPELIIVSTPPLSTFRAAEQFRRRFGTRVAVDIMDAWPDAFASLLPLPPCIARTAVRLLLAPLLTRFRREVAMADAVTATSESYLELARELGATAAMAAFHHSCANVTDPPPEAAGYGSYAPLRILYSGNMGSQYDLDTMIDAMGMLHGRGVRVSLKIAGSGPAEERLRRLAANVPGVSFLGFLDAAGLDAALSRAEVGIIPLLPSSAVAIPYKLPDYSSRGLAIVECLGGETGTLVARYKAGAHYAARNAASLADAIAAFATDRQCLAAARRASASMARAEFLQSEIYPAFADFLI